MNESDTVAARPDARVHYTDIAQRLAGRPLFVCLDYDGTLTPIVDRPEHALLADEMRSRLRTLARLCAVAVVSGRDRSDVQRLVGLDELIYAGSHGYDISGPNDLSRQQDATGEILPALDRAEALLRRQLAAVDGAQVERKRFAIAVHYRRVAAADIDRVAAMVEAVLAGQSRWLRPSGGKKVFELRPRLDWDKGRAVLWLLDTLCDPADRGRMLPLYIGDDETDEDAFTALRRRDGIGIRVADAPVRATAAHYSLESPAAVGQFLNSLIHTLRTAPP